MYKAYILSGGEWVEVRPLGDVIIESQREGDEIFFRRNLSQELTFIGSDYDLILNLPPCTEIKIKLRHPSPDINDWDGYFLHTMCAWDLDNCTITVKPEPDDKYRPVMDILQLEQDLIPVPTVNVLGTMYGLYPSDYMASKPILVTAGGILNIVPPTYEVISGYYSLKSVKYVAHFDRSFFNILFYTRTNEYVRDELYIAIDRVPEMPAFGASWVYDAEYNSQPNRQNDRYIREYKGGVWTSYVQTDSMGLTVFELDVRSGDDLVNTYRGTRRLTDCLLKMLERADIQEIRSDFFVAQNPISGTDLNLNGLMICQASDAKGRSDLATKFTHKLSDIFDMLKMLNVFWSIGDDGSLILEHRRYFDNGGSYTQPPQIGVDLTELLNSRTGKPYISKMNKYSFDINDLFSEIMFEFAYGETPHFKPIRLQYMSNCIAKKNTKTQKANHLITDLRGMLRLEKAPDDGIVLMTTSLDLSNTRRVSYNFDPKNPYLLMPNGGLSAFLITTKLWMDDADSALVRIDGKEYLAYSTKKSKKQVDLTFPFCADMDSNKTVVTELGIGRISTLQQNWKHNEMTLVLEYEWDKAL